MLALDFDGVISDSAAEAFVVSLRSHARMREASPLADRLQRLDGPGGAPDSERIRAEPLYRAFVDLMPLGNRAEDYEVILAALEEGVDLPDQAAYDAFYQTHAPDFLADYHRCFYEERAAFARSEPRIWESLMQPYEAFVALLRRRAGDVALAIATAKDRSSVRQLLRCYGVEDLFDEDRLLDKEAGRSKRAHLVALQQRWGGPFDRISFVDDKVNHLDGVAPLGVACVLAAWGYNGAREHELARARGYEVCELEEAERLLFP